MSHSQTIKSLLEQTGLTYRQEGELFLVKTESLMIDQPFWIELRLDEAEGHYHLATRKLYLLPPNLSAKARFALEVTFENVVSLEPMQNFEITAFAEDGGSECIRMNYAYHFLLEDMSAEDFKGTFETVRLGVENACLEIERCLQTGVAFGDYLDRQDAFTAFVKKRFRIGYDDKVEDPQQWKTWRNENRSEGS